MRHIDPRVFGLRTAFQASDPLFQAAVARARTLLWEGWVYWNTADVKTRPHWDIRVLGDDAFLSWLPLEVPPGLLPFEALLHACLPEAVAERTVQLESALRLNRGFSSHALPLLLADGTLRELHEDLQLETRTPGVWRVVGTLTDTTPLKRLESQLQTALTKTGCLVWQCTLDRLPLTSTRSVEQARAQGTTHRGHYYRWMEPTLQNEALLAETLPLDRSPEESYSQAFFRQLTPTQNVYEALERGSPTYTHSFPVRLKDGSTRQLVQEVQITCLHRDRWLLVGYCTAPSPQRSTSLLQQPNLLDPLTGLPNRFALLEQLEQLSPLTDEQTALVILNLDHFKVLNDSLGDQEGDRILRRVAQRLKWVVQTTFQAESAGLFRLSGDEFALLFPRSACPQDPLELVDALLQALSAPFTMAEQSVTLTASAGITLAMPSHVRNLLRQADMALHQAKRQGRSQCCLFHEEMENKAHRRFEIEVELRKALERGEIQPHFQPIHNLTTNTITTLEALARWKHPQKGMISPAEFIPVAEETGLILPLGNQVLRLACLRIKEWRKTYPTLRVSVNVSGIQLCSPWFVETVLSLLDELELPPDALILEITESVLMTDSSPYLLVLQALAEAGIQLAIDDFGTGYSSMAYLSQLPVQILKIDRMFVNKLEQDTGVKDNAAIIRAVVALARSQEMQVTAEGIETYDQLKRLQDLGCDHGQGYFLAKPMPTEDLTALLERQTL